MDGRWLVGYRTILFGEGVLGVTDELCVVSAAMPPVLLYLADGKVRTLTASR